MKKSVTRTQRVLGLIVIIFAATAWQGLQMLKEASQIYLFGYPLVLMDTTCRTSTATESNRACLNQFVHIREFPDHRFRRVVRPNRDTLYSSVWMDLTDGPLVLTVPDTAGRYYVMPLMDAWTNVFAYIGKRTTGTKAGSYLIAGPDWKSENTAGLEVLHSPTNRVWLIGRIQTNGAGDYDAVHELQDKFTLIPFNSWPGGSPIQAASADNEILLKETVQPSAMVESMSHADFYTTMMQTMMYQPVSPDDAEILDTLTSFGMEPEKTFSWNDLPFYRRLILGKAREIVHRKLKDVADSDARAKENGWAVVRKGIGKYGTDYQTRAFVAMIGLGALEPVEAAYPKAVKDNQGRFLSGEYSYRIHFEPGQTPPVDAFWSLTMYQDNFLIKNSINRYNLSIYDPLQYNLDGSLDILIQPTAPQKAISNWLPAPAGRFDISMRLYLPQKAFLDGSWKLPSVERIKK